MFFFCCRLCFNENFLATFQVFGDVPHVKTGATALHVSGAKGYIKVMGILLQAGAAVNAQVSIVLIIVFRLPSAIGSLISQQLLSCIL